MSLWLISSSTPLHGLDVGRPIDAFQVSRLSSFHRRSLPTKFAILEGEIAVFGDEVADAGFDAEKQTRLALLGRDEI